jgi:hypothetical protein
MLVYGLGTVRCSVSQAPQSHELGARAAYHDWLFRMLEAKSRVTRAVHLA